jgi:hypothetical protein
MGILDRLKGKSGGAIEVVADPTEAGPGQEITVRLDVKEEFDDKARELRAGITCTGKYKVRETRRNSNGNVENYEEWRTYEIYEEYAPLQLATGPQEAKFFLPDEAQPVSEDCVEWAAWARVDRDKGIDVVERIPLNVRVPTDRVPAQRDSDPAGDGMTLVGVAPTVRAGEALTGTLVVELPEDLKCNAVSIRLHRRATYVAQAVNDYSVYGGSLIASLFFGSHTSKIVKDEQVAEIELADGREFAAGRREQFEFSIDVPMAGPTSSHQYAQIDWRLEAVLDRRLRDDKSVEEPILVL